MKSNEWKCNRLFINNQTFGDAILRYTRIGASEVLVSWDGWLMVSQSKTTSCSGLANSNILSISACTSTAQSQTNIQFSYKIYGGLLKSLPTMNSCCRMTNYELHRWLVEMPSRDVDHYQMINASRSMMYHSMKRSAFDEMIHSQSVIVYHFIEWYRSRDHTPL